MIYVHVAWSTWYGDVMSKLYYQIAQVTVWEYTLRSHAGRDSNVAVEHSAMQ